MPSATEVKEVKEINDVKEKIARIGPVKNYTDLLVYRQAYRLALSVSKFTKVFLEKSSLNWDASFAGAPGRCPQTLLRVGRNGIPLPNSSGTC
jgi:hypothetical protein